ncbi:type I-C CRISPR-associated protein Cas8c/Csd1 [Nonomuraea aurantiaca]|uniref:type I-C CRISPR-associated protein Cas8c/Csd1 n=1 Tax=Nonomuraea aurantiaca TaxID=2878562 RepID=UPI001CD9CB7A|nr:type I-C CRISPR-associated protein Cas8c/Csd1 [Nonomuraea aurantiaca]MCA2229616.1 type I-C CRISPR-associated protein Cas8c/Csd1 [Nonomuraea aurantiaca]
MLHYLAAHARQENLRYGWRRRTIAWLLDITDPTSPVWEKYGQAEEVPYVRRSGSGAWPRPACDTIDYLTCRYRAAWLKMMADYAQSAHDEHVAAALGALATLDPPPGAVKGDLAAVRASGRFIHETSGLAAFWNDTQRAGLDSGKRGVCVSCGQVAQLARLIPAYIPPAAFGGRGSGDMALAPTSAGKSGRGGQALLCLDCAIAFGAALPTLAQHPRHHHVTAVDGEMVMWWTLGGPQFPLGDLLNKPHAGGLTNVDVSGRVCLLVLKPSGAGRIAIRWGMQEPAAVVRDRVAAWYDVITVETGYDSRLFGITALYGQLGRWNKATGTYSDLPRDRMPESGLWIAALSGRPAPGYAYAAINACRRDGRVSFGRTALIQAFLPGSNLAALPDTTQEQPMTSYNTTVTLLETKADVLVIVMNDQAWTLQIGGDHMLGQFAADAEAWANGDWEPNEHDGQNPTDVDDTLREVATWTRDRGLEVVVRPDELGGAARDYLGVHPEE